VYITLRVQSAKYFTMNDSWNFKTYIYIFFLDGWPKRTSQTADPDVALMTGNPVFLISTKGARRMWLVSLLLLSTWSYLRICRGSMLPYTRFCNCLLGCDYVLHIVNFAILYLRRLLHTYFSDGWSDILLRRLIHAHFSDVWYILTSQSVNT
jgi:hypothetical protein